jgi:hypothetical protein
VVVIEGGIAAYNYNLDSGRLERVRSDQVADPDVIIQEGADGNFYCKACGQLIDNMWTIPRHAFCSSSN